MMRSHAAGSVLPNTAGFAHPPRNVAALGIEPGMNVADFGSGSGAYVLAIAEALQGSGHVYAVDIQKDLLRRTYNEAQKRNFSNVSILWGDLEKQNGSKLADGACDLVLISNLLFQVDDKKTLLHEAARVVRHKGRVAIIDWQESFGGMGPVLSQVVNKVAALALAKTCNLKLQKEFEAGAHHYGLVLQKVHA